MWARHAYPYQLCGPSPYPPAFNHVYTDKYGCCVPDPACTQALADFLALKPPLVPQDEVTGNGGPVPSPQAAHAAGSQPPLPLHLRTNEDDLQPGAAHVGMDQAAGADMGAAVGVGVGVGVGEAVGAAPAQPEGVPMAPHGEGEGGRGLAVLACGG